MAASANLPEKWEREYASVKDAVLQVKRGDDTRNIDARVRALEGDLRQFGEDAVGSRRTKIADLKRSLLLRQAEGRGVAVSAMSSSSSRPNIDGANQVQTTEQLNEYSQQELNRMRQRLDPISNTIGDIRDIGLATSDAAQLQTRLIDELSDDTQGLTMMQDNIDRRMRDVARASDTRNLRCAILGLVALFIVLLVMKV